MEESGRTGAVRNVAARTRIDHCIAKFTGVSFHRYLSGILLLPNFFFDSRPILPKASFLRGYSVFFSM